MNCQPGEPCTCDDELCGARIEEVNVHDDRLMVRSADGAVHSLPIETR